jgi:hypothetical protein
MDGWLERAFGVALRDRQAGMVKRSYFATASACCLCALRHSVEGFGPAGPTGVRNAHRPGFSRKGNKLGRPACVAASNRWEWASGAGSHGAGSSRRRRLFAGPRVHSRDATPFVCNDLCSPFLRYVIETTRLIIPPGVCWAGSHSVPREHRSGQEQEGITDPNGNPGCLRDRVERLPTRPRYTNVRARSANVGSGTGGWSLAGPGPASFLTDEIVIRGLLS